MAKKDPNIHTLFSVKDCDLKWNQKQQITWNNSFFIFTVISFSRKEEERKTLPNKVHPHHVPHG